MTAPRGRRPARSPGATSGARGAVVIGLAVILGIVGLQILDDSGNGSGTAAVTTVPGVTTPVSSTAGSTPTTGSATTTASTRPANQVRVKVYNASGVQGRAQTLTDVLRAKNYNMQAPANLDKQRQGTVVECTKAFAAEAPGVAAQVPGGATVQPYPSNPPDGASDADCLVIIGTA